MKKPTVGVILSGCGVQDGAEIHEAVLTLLALDRVGAEIRCFAPDRAQLHVVDHRTGNLVSESRNVLTEAARIARGHIQDLAQADVGSLDAIMIPGGFGAAKNLCTFAVDGAECTVDPDVARVLREAHAAGKPIAALCIAPAILAALFGKTVHPHITIGSDPGTAAALEAMGARHVVADPTGVVVDHENRFVTVPCYMSASRISEIADGAAAAVRELQELLHEKVHKPS